jgi:hypothetical protein
MNRASMQRGVMPNGNIVPNMQRTGVMSNMQRGIVLNIGAFSNANETHIAAYDRIKPNAAITTDNDIANDDDAFAKKNTIVNHGKVPIVRY